jgi:hypothetical protein
MITLMKYLFVFAAGMSLVVFLYNRPSLEEPNVSAQVDAAIPNVKKFIGKLSEQSQNIVEQQSEDFKSIYKRLGLKSGDMIKKVNDFSVTDAAHKVFPALVEGFKSGNVCVVYQRNGEDREACLKKNPGSENVTDNKVSSN